MEGSGEELQRFKVGQQQAKEQLCLEFTVTDAPPLPAQRQGGCSVPQGQAAPWDSPAILTFPCGHFQGFSSSPWEHPEMFCRSDGRDPCALIHLHRGTTLPVMGASHVHPKQPPTG